MKNDKRPESTRILQILRQMENLSYGDFISLSEILDVQSDELHKMIAAGVETEKGKSQ